MGKEILCPDCRSNDIRQFRACGYHKIRCNKCYAVHSSGIVSSMVEQTELVSSVRGIAPVTTVVTRVSNAATKRMEHETRHANHKTISVGDSDE